MALWDTNQPTFWTWFWGYFLMTVCMSLVNTCSVLCSRSCRDWKDRARTIVTQPLPGGHQEWEEAGVCDQPRYLPCARRRVSDHEQSRPGHSPSAAQLQVDETDNKSQCWQSTMDATRKIDGEFQMGWSGKGSQGTWRSHLVWKKNQGKGRSWQREGRGWWLWVREEVYEFMVGRKEETKDGKVNRGRILLMTLKNSLTSFQVQLEVIAGVKQGEW